jgi:hypothetical protein
MLVRVQVPPSAPYLVERPPGFGGLFSLRVFVWARGTNPVLAVSDGHACCASSRPIGLGRKLLFAVCPAFGVPVVGVKDVEF